MRSTLGTSRPQRQVLYSALKGVNSSVVFFLWPPTEYRNDLITVDGHKKKHKTYKTNCNISVFFCSHSVLPTEMTCGKMFIFVFLKSHSGCDPNKFCGGKKTINKNARSTDSQRNCFLRYCKSILYTTRRPSGMITVMDNLAVLRDVVRISEFDSRWDYFLHSGSVATSVRARGSEIQILI